jgi:predicted HTH transcriptional regulator
MLILMIEMNPKEIKALIESGESTTIEFKRKATTPEKLAKEFAAIANTKGGYILFGVEDNGKVYGIESEKSEIDIIERTAGFHVTPPVEISLEFATLNGKDMIICKIPESKSKPHKVMVFDEDKKRIVPRTYIRVGEKSLLASNEMARLLTYSSHDKPLTLSIGDKEKRLFSYLEKYERATVSDFANLVNISKRRAEQLLVRLVRAQVLQIHNDSSYDYFTLPA